MLDECSIDGDVGDLAVDGDIGDRPLRSRKRKRQGAEALLLDTSCEPGICFVVARQKGRSIGRHLGRFVDHPEFTFWWPGGDCVAGAILFKWQYHSSASLGYLPEQVRSVCSEAQKSVRGMLSGFIVYQAIAYAVRRSADRTCCRRSP